MWWRIESGEKWQDLKGEEAKKRFRAMIDNGVVRGLRVVHFRQENRFP
jgi:hypothetical protein